MARIPELAGRFYWAAGILLIAVLFHPRLPRRAAVGDPAGPAGARNGAHADGASGIPLDVTPATRSAGPVPAQPAAYSLPVRVKRAPAVTAPKPASQMEPWLPGAARATTPAGPPATPAPARAGALPTRPAGGARPALVPAEPETPATPATPARRANLWARWVGLRARLGWRLTGPGLVLTLALAAASAYTLIGNIASPLGGWLWAGALVALLLTFAGAPRWPRGLACVMPGPEDDFFAPGVPRLSVPWEAALVVAMLGVALGLRLFNLEYMPGIFGDEGERGMDARAILEGRPTLLFGYGWWGVPNLYFYCVAFMLRLFGDNMVGDRMLSVLCGVLAVWFVYRTGRLLWGPRAGLIAGALLAVSPVALQFSRWAGESTPTGTLWAAGFFFLVRALRERRWSDWALGGTLAGFSLYFYAAGKLIFPCWGSPGSIASCAGVAPSSSATPSASRSRPWPSG